MYCTEEEFTRFWQDSVVARGLKEINYGANPLSPLSPATESPAVTGTRAAAWEEAKASSDRRPFVPREYLMDCMALVSSCSAEEGGSSLPELVEKLGALPYHRVDGHCSRCCCHLNWSCHAKDEVCEVIYLYNSIHKLVSFG